MSLFFIFIRKNVNSKIYKYTRLITSFCKIQKCKKVDEFVFTRTNQGLSNTVNRQAGRQIERHPYLIEQKQQ